MSGVGDHFLAVAGLSGLPQRGYSPEATDPEWLEQGETPGNLTVVVVPFGGNGSFSNL
jgi:hypothetical protein